MMRWEAQKGLPIHRVPGGQRNAVYAYKGEIDEWLKLGESRGTDVLEDRPSIDESVESSEHASARHEDPTSATSVTPDLLSRRKPWIGGDAKKLSLACLAVALIAICGFTWHSFETERDIRVTGIAQLTDDGTLKEGLVTDGNKLFFAEHRGGRLGMFSLPMSGGTAQEINTSLIRAFPVDVSSDGKRLLVLAVEGYEKERPLWILTVENGDSRQVGTVTCHAAAWSPDGNAIAFASHNAVYLTPDQGRTVHPIQTFEGVPESISWSKDASRLRVELHDYSTSSFSFWDLSLEKPSLYKVAALVPLKTDLTEFFNGSMATENDRSFLVGGDTVSSGILTLVKSGSILRTRYSLQNLDVPLAGTTSIALDWQKRRILAIGSAAVPRMPRKEHADILWFDQNSREFRPFLPGSGGEYADFSRDGRRIVYFSNLDRSLHVCRADGLEDQRLVASPGTIQLPRWSPDGRWIAYMEQLPNKPWRIFVIPANGGSPREAGQGEDSQGAPTWSMDGRRLAYGGVECQEMKTCAVHKIELANGRESIVPGSEGLGTARWSPDGRLIAALDSVKHRVMLFSESTRQWKELALGVNGNDLSWSTDSKSLFAGRHAGDQPEIIRIDIFDGKITTALDMSELSRLQGRFDSWFAIGPGNAIILSREMSTNEIFSISYEN